MENSVSRDEIYDAVQVLIEALKTAEGRDIVREISQLFYWAGSREKCQVIPFPKAGERNEK